MIKNKIIFALLFATITNFSMQINLSAKEQNSKESKIKEKSKLTKAEKKELILKALTQDSSILTKALSIPKTILEEISLNISAAILGLGTTAIINADLFKQCMNVLLKENIDLNTKAQELKKVLNENSDKGIQFVAELMILPIGYYVLLKIIKHKILKKDDTTEKIKKLAAVLEQFNV